MWNPLTFFFFFSSILAEPEWCKCRDLCLVSRVVKKPLNNSHTGATYWCIQVSLWHAVILVSVARSSQNIPYSGWLMPYHCPKVHGRGNKTGWKCHLSWPLIHPPVGNPVWAPLALMWIAWFTWDLQEGKFKSRPLFNLSQNRVHFRKMPYSWGSGKLPR